MAGDDDSGASTTYDYYKRLFPDEEDLDKMVSDTEKLLGYVSWHILTEQEYVVMSGGRRPPSSAFYVPDDKEIFIIIGDKPLTFPDFWYLICHEKGHHFEYPRTAWRRVLETGTIVATLKKLGDISTAVQSKYSVSRTITMDIQNLIEDALINYMNCFDDRVERDLEYFGWFARESRNKYEIIFLDLDVSKSTPMLDSVIFHHRFMTALGWFYLGVDSISPTGVKRGIEPYRELCVVRCKSCGEDFATWNFRCPECNEWNNTLGDRPDFGLLRDSRSPLVCGSDDKRVRRQYRLLQDFFVYVTKLDWARRRPAGERDDIFFNKFFTRLSRIYGNLIKTGCRYGMSDMPKFLGFRRLAVPVAGKDRKIDVIPLYGKYYDKSGGRNYLELSRMTRCTNSDLYGDLIDDIGDFDIEDILPHSSLPIYGEYGLEKYRSLDDWEEDNLLVRVTRKFNEFEAEMSSSVVDEEAFEPKFLNWYNKLGDDEKRAVASVLEYRGSGMYVDMAMGVLRKLMGGGVDEGQ